MAFHGRKSDKKIKIGYFSADFRKHAVGNLVVNLFELHDKSKFEIYCFYFGPDTNDEIYQRISNTVYKFINVRYKSEKEIAQLSRDLKIDISIDLMGYTIKNRSKIFIEKESQNFNLEDLGGICFNSDIYSIKHENLKTRIYKT